MIIVGSPDEKMTQLIDDIFHKVGITSFDTVINHGCGNRSHYNATLRNYGSKLIGVDIYDRVEVGVFDDYVKVPQEIIDSYFGNIKSNTIDCVFMFSIYGLHHDGNWESYFLITPDDRVARYFTEQNYPRIIKSGGYVLIVEWEPEPEKRLGKASYNYVNANIEQYYPGVNLPGFEIIAKGFSTQLTGPYILYRKLAK